MSRKGGAARILLKGMSWQTSAQLLPLVINLAMTPWIITGLGPQRYSIFLIVSTATLLISQFDGGIGPSAMRYFTIYAGRDDKAATTRLLVSVSFVIAAVSGLVTVLAIVFTDPILAIVRVAPEYLHETRILFRTLTAMVTLILLRNLFSAVVNSRQLFRVTASASLAGYAVYMTGIVLTVINGWGLVGVAITMVLQQVIGSLITVPASLRYLTRPSPWFMNRREGAEFFRYAWRVQVTGLSNIITSQKDQLVAGWLITAQQSGPYGQGSNFAGNLRSMALNATYPMQAMIGSEVAQRGAEAAVAKVTKLQRVWVAAVVGWCGIGSATAYFAVRAWMPESYELAAPVASTLLVGIMFAMLKHVSNLWSLTLGHSEIEMRASLVGMLTNLALTVVLGSFIGMAGVVLGTVLGQFVSMLFFSWQFRRVEVQLPWFVRQVPVLALVLGLAVTLGLQLLADGHLPQGALGLLTGALLGGPGVVVYAVVAFGPSGLKQAIGTLRGR
ncbi:MAG: oligosaccharide flippase family protein [Dermatophilus congolensis]|nr:oligosaccharide flippase family protein [Dermatophilus congolensis]